MKNAMLASNWIHLNEYHNLYSPDSQTSGFGFDFNVKPERNTSSSSSRKWDPNANGEEIGDLEKYKDLFINELHEWWTEMMTESLSQILRTNKDHFIEFVNNVSMKYLILLWTFPWILSDDFAKSRSGRMLLCTHRQKGEMQTIIEWCSFWLVRDDLIRSMALISMAAMNKQSENYSLIAAVETWLCLIGIVWRKHRSRIWWKPPKQKRTFNFQKRFGVHGNHQNRINHEVVMALSIIYMSVGGMQSKCVCEHVRRAVTLWITIT